LWRIVHGWSYVFEFLLEIKLKDWDLNGIPVHIPRTTKAPPTLTASPSTQMEQSPLDIDWNEIFGFVLARLDVGWQTRTNGYGKVLAGEPCKPGDMLRNDSTLERTEYLSATEI
jgi:hypothetical protein